MSITAKIIIILIKLPTNINTTGAIYTTTPSTIRNSINIITIPNPNPIFLKISKISMIPPMKIYWTIIKKNQYKSNSPIINPIMNGINSKHQYLKLKK